MSCNTYPITFNPTDFTFNSFIDAANVFVDFYCTAMEKSFATVYDFMRLYLKANIGLDIEDTVIPEWWIEWGWKLDSIPKNNRLECDYTDYFFIKLPRPIRIKDKD